MTQPASTADHDLLIEIKTMLNGVLSRDEDKEKRLRALEAFRSRTYGALAVLSVLSGSGLFAALITR